MRIKKQIKRVITLLILLQLLPVCIKAQITKDAFNVIVNQLTNPIRMEIVSHIRQADRKQSKCDLNFFSIKFIVNESYQCDSVAFSKSVDDDLKTSLSQLIKKSDLDWKIVLKDFNANKNGDYRLLLPIYLTRDRCPKTKLSGYEVWNIFRDVMMTEDNDFNQFIILGTVSMSMSH